MPTWTLVAVDTPLNGSWQHSELSMASNRSFSFSLESPATLSFEMPGRHWQTALLEPLTTDILVYRDDWCVQRFRLTAADWSKQDGQLRCSFTAVSYRALLDAWVFHESHTRAFTNTEQTAIAWTIISQSQSMASSNLALTRGLYPVIPVNRDLLGDWDETNNPARYYFEVGKKKGEAVNEIAALTSGFEWDIEPDRTDQDTASTALKFNTWNAGYRRQYSPRCPLVLDDGGNVEAWSRKVEPSEYANVIRAVGQYPTGVASGTDAPPAVWAPSTGNPGGTPVEGRWESAVSLTVMSQDALTSAAGAELDRRLAYQPEWAVSLARGRWRGPSEMWVGDTCRLIVDDGPVQVDADVRVLSVKVAVDDDGGEKVDLELNRPARSYLEFRRDLERRLLNLETR